MKKLAIASFILSLSCKAQTNVVNYEKHIVVLYKTLSATPMSENFDVRSVLSSSFKYNDSLIKGGQIIKAGGFGKETFEKYTRMEILKEGDLLKGKNIIMKDPGYGKLFEADFFVWLQHRVGCGRLS